MFFTSLKRSLRILLFKLKNNFNKIFKFCEFGETGFGIMKLDELGEMSFGISKLGELGKTSFGILELGAANFGIL